MGGHQLVRPLKVLEGQVPEEEATVIEILSPPVAQMWRGAVDLHAWCMCGREMAG